jgi:hypothetical protein
VRQAIRAEAASALDDAGSATVLYELMLPYADRVAVSYPEISTGSASRYLGLLAATTGRHITRRRTMRVWPSRKSDDGVVANVEAFLGGLRLARAESLEAAPEVHPGPVGAGVA